MRKPSFIPSGPAFRPKGAAEGTIEQGMGFIHPCFVDGCEEVAPFGFGVSILKGDTGFWACAIHRADAEALFKNPTGGAR
jgi:hypothetical protein